jgi:hypothetical protein
MDKKAVYEHLAKIYLDASSKSTRKKKPSRFKLDFIRPSLLITIALTFGFSALILNLNSSRRHNPANSETALYLQEGPAKINFNFNPAKKEVYTLSLNRLNISRFKALAFSVKKSDYHDNINLKVEFANAFREKSFIYVRNIPYRWGEYRINLSDFKNISDWSIITELSFIVEEWNARDKFGIILVDNVRLLN